MVSNCTDHFTIQISRANHKFVTVYFIGGGTLENLFDYISTLQEELVRAGVLPEDYDYEGHHELVPMQPGDIPVTYADSKALEDDYGF